MSLTSALDPAVATPIRAARPGATAGECTVLRAVRSSYRDGAEERLLEMVAGAADLGSLNEELHAQATTWAERYHVDRQRVNVLRAFDLSGAERVLEVGAGCGAMSRYLAEACTFVDALEPVQARAAVAAQRLRDLPGARVFAGELADLPDQPSYDLIVVIGVLEYVGGGTADEAPYLEFLADIRRRLLPGGRLLLAIENKLGVKYLAGSPEDHSDRAYDSLEGYPVGTPARTFDRAALEGLFERAGFGTTFFAAFPDYKLTRVVMSEEFLTDASGLAERLPRFPSPDWQTPRTLGPNEELLWRSLVEAGQGPVHGNSFVVLASPGAPVEDLWPVQRQAAFFTTERRPGRATHTVVDRTDDGLVLRRRLLGELRDQEGPRHRVGSGPVLPGRPLIDAIAHGDLDFTRRVLSEWRAMVADSARAEDGVAIDLVPHNLLIDDDGRLTFVDDEWHSVDWTADDVVARGLIWLCERLSTVPTRWRDRPSRRALLNEFAELIDFAPPGDWTAAAMHREAVLQVQLLRRAPGDAGYEAEVARTEHELGQLLELSMEPPRPQLAALMAERDALRAELTDARQRQGELHDDVVRTHAALAAAHEELSSIHRSIGFRAVAAAHDGVARLAPAGTRRREFYDRMSRQLSERRRGKA